MTGNQRMQTSGRSVCCQKRHSEIGRQGQQRHKNNIGTNTIYGFRCHDLTRPAIRISNPCLRQRAECESISLFATKPERGFLYLL